MFAVYLFSIYFYIYSIFFSIFTTFIWIKVASRYSQVEKPSSTMKLSHMNFVRSPKMIWTGGNRDTSRQSSKPETANVHQQQKQQQQQHFTLHSSHFRNFLLVYC